MKGTRIMNKKILSLLLALLMVCTVLAACGSKKDVKETQSSETGNVGVDEFAEVNAYVEGLVASQGTFGGKTFTIIGSPRAIVAEDQEETGNLENDALYKRQRDLEDYFDIEIEFVESKGVDSGYENTGAETADKVRTDVMSSLASYDLINGNLMTCGRIMLNNGSIAPVGDISPLDFSQSWWLNDLEEQFTISNQLYFLTGKIAPSHYGDAACILYNKDVAENFDIPDLYSIVKSGDWTFDKMVEIASVIDAGSDIYRYHVSGASGGLTYYFGAGFDLAQTDEEGHLYIAKSLTSEQSDFIDKVASVFKDTKATANGQIMYERGETFTFGEDATDGFIDGKILFHTTTMGDPSALREKDVEFGILPVPKKDVDQKEYISLATAWMTAGVYFETVLTDVEMTATITEAMAALSAKHLEPAYYEKALKGRGTYDTDSRDMLDLIYKTKVIDLADTYQWGGVVEIINNACNGSNESYVSGYTGASIVANKTIERLEKQIAANNK